MFKPGDKVICVDDGNGIMDIDLHGIYTVKECYKDLGEDGFRVRLHGLPFGRGYFNYRFKLYFREEYLLEDNVLWMNLIFMIRLL